MLPLPKPYKNHLRTISIKRAPTPTQPELRNACLCLLRIWTLIEATDRVSCQEIAAMGSLFPLAFQKKAKNSKYLPRKKQVSRSLHSECGRSISPRRVPRSQTIQRNKIPGQLPSRCCHSLICTRRPSKMTPSARLYRQADALNFHNQIRLDRL